MAMYARTGTLYEVGLQELGMAMIRETLRDAAKLFLGTSLNRYEAAEIHQSVIFIRGSGLEAVSKQLGLPLDIDVLKEGFQWKLRQLASSSATMLSGHSLKGA